ncbi:MAG: hypothetical protein HY391_03540, partial [Deltaproteobacteria bacterium]|nr:hypothetical protein [Deltaproteobacteria bacterium]
MRLFLCSLLAFVCLMLPQALYADGGEVPTPAQFIKKAKESRIAFLEVVSEIRERMGELRTRQETETYMGMLGDLLEVSRTLHVEKLGGDPVGELGRDLSRHSLSRGWLFMEKEDTSTLLLHHEWADPSDAFDYLISFRNSYEPLRTRREILPDETADFQRSLSNIHALFQWAQRKKHPAWLLSAYCQLSADLSNLILQQRLYLFSQEERVLWTNNLSTQGGVSDFLFLLENEVRKIERETKERVHPLIQYLLLVPNLDAGQFGFTLST